MPARDSVSGANRLSTAALPATPAALATLCATALVLRWVFVYYVNVFFAEGDEYDLNVFAHLIWRNEAFNYFAHFPQSFFSIHVSPLLYLVNGLSFVVPTDQETWFGGFRAAIHAAFVPVFAFLWWRAMVPSQAAPGPRCRLHPRLSPHPAHWWRSASRSTAWCSGRCGSGTTNS
jgi:hypothetical protein